MPCSRMLPRLLPWKPPLWKLRLLRLRLLRLLLQKPLPPRLPLKQRLKPLLQKPLHLKLRKEPDLC